MKRFFEGAIAIALVLVPFGISRAQEPGPVAILDKAIQAIGGKEKLEKAKAASWKSKATITIDGNENEMKLAATVQGLDHYRAEFEGDFNGNKFKGVTIVKGGKGWRKFADMAMELEGDALANEKRTIYLAAAPMTLVSLKDKSFKLEPAAETKVADKPAVGIKVTPADGKEFTLFFDKESGLLVKQVAKVSGWDGSEFTQETTYSDYKDFDGIKKAAKLVSTRDGDPFVNQEVTEFKFMDQAPAGTFDEPK